MTIHASVDETTTHFALKHAIAVFSIIPIRTIRKNGNLTTSYKLFTGKWPNIKKFRVLLSPCVVNKYTATKRTENDKYVTIDVNKQCSQKGVRGMFVGFDKYTLGYLIYKPSIRKIVMSVDIAFDEEFVTALAYKNSVYREALLTMPVTETFNFHDNIGKMGDNPLSYLTRTNTNY